MINISSNIKVSSVRLFVHTPIALKKALIPTLRAIKKAMHEI